MAHPALGTCHVRTPDHIAAFRALCEEYAASLPFIAVSLEHQGFEREMATLPGKYAPPAGEALLAMLDGAAVGCAALRPLSFAEAGAEGACELKRMYVRPHARGLGAGRLLGEAILHEAASRGYRVIKLDTDRTMLPAIALYRSLGFVECPAYNTDPCAETLWFEKPL